MERESETTRGLPWVAIVAVVAVTMLVSAAGSLVASRVRRAAMVQPIAFNHRLHAGEQKIECSTCHAYFETEAFSGLPDNDVCAMCHTEVLGKSAEEAKLVKLLKDDQPLVWRSLFRQPTHVYYSHRRHVVQAKLKCEQCHGDFAGTTAPPDRVAKLTMSECVECHQTRGIAADCTTCHR